MRRSVEYGRNFKVEKYDDGSWSLQLEVSLESAGQLLFELQLLDFGLSERLSLRAADSAKLAFSRGPGDPGELVADEDLYRCSLSERDIGVISKHLLLYLRDGATPVPFLDVELRDRATLVIASGSVARPGSSSKAEMRAHSLDDDRR